MSLIVTIKKGAWLIPITLAIGAALVPATAYASATNCNPNPLQEANECTSVKGTGLYVDSIGGQLFSNTYAEIDHVHIEIYGPHGHIHNCGEFNLAPLGVSEPCVWVNPHPHIHVTAGDYCSRAWERIGSGERAKYFVLSAECVGVHR
jgi:hypothetical protein